MKAFAHRPGGGVELAHRLQAEAKLHRPEHRRRAVHRRIDRVPLDVRADRQGDRPVGVDVVRAVLGVVLDHEDGQSASRTGSCSAPRPPGPAPGRCRRRTPCTVGLAGAGARGVVVGQPQDDQPGHLARLLEPGQLLEEPLGALHVGIVQVEAAELAGRSAPRGP